MKRIFGVALLALPLLAGSAGASGWPFNVQAGGSFYIKGGPGPAYPQAGPWYLYWPLEAHFVAPAPTGYPYWPAPQGLPNLSFGGPTCPPGVPVPPPAVAAPPAVAIPPVSTVPIPTTQSAPATQPAPPATPPAAPQTITTPTQPQIPLPPYLQPTSYRPAAAVAQPSNYCPFIPSGQAPSYWYDR